jgi:hypothetical protein
VGLAVWLARRPKPRKNDWCAGEGKFPMGVW